MKYYDFRDGIEIKVAVRGIENRAARRKRVIAHDGVLLLFSTDLWEKHHIFAH